MVYSRTGEQPPLADTREDPRNSEDPAQPKKIRKFKNGTYCRRLNVLHFNKRHHVWQGREMGLMECSDGL